MDSAPPKSSRDEGDVPSQTKNGGDKRLGEYGYDQLPISNIKRIHPAQYHRHFLAQGIRADGRKISDFRRLDIRTG